MRTLIAVALVSAVSVAGAQDRTPDFTWAKSLSAGSNVRLHNISGNIDVVPSTSGKVEVNAYRTRDADDDIRTVVHESGSGIDVCVIRDGDECDEDGMHGHHDSWGGRHSRGDMNLRVAVPSNVQVSAGSVSGDVAIDGAQGDLHASTVSGDVRVQHARIRSLSATSVSGNVDAQVDALTGGGDLRFRSVSGDVTLEVPKSFDADLRMSSVSGRLTTDFPITLTGGYGRRNVEARIGNGGRRLEISTVSGDARIRTPK